jgi:hypothetical protein
MEGMKFDKFWVNTQADCFETWLRVFAENRSLRLEVHHYLSGRRRCDLIRDQDTVVAVEALPVSRERVQVQTALLAPSGIDDCAAFFREVCQAYSTKLLSQLGSVNSAWLRFLHVEKPHDDPEKESKRQTLIATLWESLPPVTETEATQFARLPPPKVIPKTPAKRLQWRRRYQEALPFIRKGDSIEQVAKKLGIPPRTLRAIIAWAEWDEQQNLE